MTTAAQAKVLARLEGARLKPERISVLTMLYNQFRARFFPNMPEVPIGVDFGKGHQDKAGCFSARQGIVLFNRRELLANSEVLAEVVLHEMVHQWMHWAAIDDPTDKAPRARGLEPGGHGETFGRKLRACLEAQFPGKKFPHAGKSKLVVR
jgi:hypothetical protein